MNYYAIIRATVRSLLLLLSVLSVRSAELADEAAPSGQARPNIVYILVDDLGWGDLGCYGNTQLKTPNLDHLAKQGARFGQYYVAAPVCSPSRVSTMTGLFPAREGIHGHLTPVPQLNLVRGMPNFLNPKVLTITKLFRNAGYATAHFGKWHLGDVPNAPPPAAYGIDESQTLLSTGPNLPMPMEGFNSRLTAMILDDALAFVKAHKEGPFYVNIWTLLPHAPLNPSQEEMAPYARFGARHLLSVPGEVGAPRDGAMTIYYAAVTSLDSQIGRFLRGLDELGLSENTIVIFSSDNGPEDIHVPNAAHSGVGSTGVFRGRKRSLYEGGIREPLIARWPGRIAAGRNDNASVLSSVDLLPTLAKLADVETPADWHGDGEDCSDILLGKSRPRHEPLFWEWRFKIWGDAIHHSPMLAMRQGDYKLLMNSDRSRIELYDISKDPTELNNLTDREPDRVRSMAGKLMEWKAVLPAGPSNKDVGVMPTIYEGPLD